MWERECALHARPRSFTTPRLLPPPACRLPPWAGLTLAPLPLLITARCTPPCLCRYPLFTVFAAAIGVVSYASYRGIAHNPSVR